MLSVGERKSRKFKKWLRLVSGLLFIQILECDRHVSVPCSWRLEDISCLACVKEVGGSIARPANFIDIVGP